MMCIINMLLIYNLFNPVISWSDVRPSNVKMNNIQLFKNLFNCAVSVSEYRTSNVKSVIISNFVNKLFTYDAVI
jgi:type III secretory pathway component EscU